MKAITIWQPWASAIVSGPKRIENRTWAPPLFMHGQRIAIHAGKTAVLAGVVRHSSDPWFAGVGAVGWVLEDVRACEPIPCRGAQGLWEVPADIAARLK